MLVQQDMGVDNVKCLFIRLGNAMLSISAGMLKANKLAKDLLTHILTHIHIK